MENTEYMKKIPIRGKDYHFYDIHRLEEKGIAAIAQLPFTIKILEKHASQMGRSNGQERRPS